MITLLEVIDKKLEDFQSNLHTILIAKITKVNDKTIDAKPVISRDVDGKKVDLPVFVDVPVINLSGGSSSISFPLSVGDYCLLLVVERCFDTWWNGTDFETPADMRMHDYSDTVALVGLNKSLNIPTTTTINGDLIINGNVTINGSLHCTGNITTDGDVIAGGKSLRNHTNGGYPVD